MAKCAIKRAKMEMEARDALRDKSTIRRSEEARNVCAFLTYRFAR